MSTTEWPERLPQDWPQSEVTDACRSDILGHVPLPGRIGEPAGTPDAAQRWFTDAGSSSRAYCSGAIAHFHVRRPTGQAHANDA